MTRFPALAPTIEQDVSAFLDDVKHDALVHYEKCRERVRRSPAKAVLIAVAAGYCLHRLPVRSMLATQVRLLGALAPPALFAFGVIKVFDCLQRKARQSNSPGELPHYGSE